MAPWYDYESLSHTFDLQLMVYVVGETDRNNILAY